jgi:hypothetical protein
MRLAVLAVFFVMNSLGQVIITDSGSTNRPGMTVTIDAKGKAQVADRRGGITAKMVIEKDLHTRLMRDLDAAVPLDQMNVRGCAKSVSFGSRTYIIYKGVQSPDISCVGQSDPVVIALQKDAQEIVALARAKMPQNNLSLR